MILAKHLSSHPLNNFWFRGTVRKKWNQKEVILSQNINTMKLIMNKVSLPPSLYLSIDVLKKNIENTWKINMTFLSSIKK